MALQLRSKAIIHYIYQLKFLKKKMKKNYLKLISSRLSGRKNFVSLLMVTLILAVAQMQAQTVVTFPFTGSVQTFTVPPCVTQITLEVWGAEGGGYISSNNTSSGYGG